MFIERQQHPAIEFDEAAGQLEPTLVHYFSDRGDPFKSVLPLLIEGAGQDDERVFVVESPLAQVVNWTIELHKHPDLPLVDERHRAFFQAIRSSLEQAIAAVDRIEYAKLDDDEPED
ncbi:hypothetical protein [Massilia sp. BKSP1R2A-1]|uniref:hypothetical protein n=1 Tax=Massilia sp. BKSP1R2A-1 TaxID=3422595 RepID=UPI003D32CCDA